MTTRLKKIKAELKALADKDRAMLCSYYFKTGEGEYGEGDIFYGITVPTLRQVAKKYIEIELEEIEDLLSHKVHEIRFIAAVLLTEKYKRARNLSEKAKIAKFYQNHLERFNNWDLIDVSAHKILGSYLSELLRDKQKDSLIVLKKLAKSSNIWRRRAAIVSTFSFIKQKNCKPTLIISDILMSDSHDLIHKANGWMLREVGKNCSQAVLLNYLDRNYKQMPRVMLRYAIERLPENKRKHYLNKK